MIGLAGLKEARCSSHLPAPERMDVLVSALREIIEAEPVGTGGWTSRPRYIAERALREIGMLKSPEIVTRPTVQRTAKRRCGYKIRK